MGDKLTDFCSCANRKRDRHGRCLSCGKVDEQTSKDMEQVMRELHKHIDELHTKSTKEGGAE